MLRRGNADPAARTQLLNRISVARGNRHRAVAAARRIRITNASQRRHHVRREFGRLVEKCRSQLTAETQLIVMG